MSKVNQVSEDAWGIFLDMKFHILWEPTGDLVEYDDPKTYSRFFLVLNQSMIGV